MVQRIRVGKDSYTLVDDDDYEFLNKYRWNVDSSGYATRYIPNKSGKGRWPHTTRRLVHEILPPIQGYEIDHKNNDRLDNRIDNLRYVTRNQNSRNSQVRKKFNGQPRSINGLKGVSLSYRGKKNNSYTSKFRENGHQVFLGYSQDPLEMAYLYDLAMLALYPEHSWLNCEHYNTDC